MSVTLSRADLDAIGRASLIALSPLDFPTASAWGTELTKALEVLLRADQSLSSITDEPGCGVIGRGARTEEAITSYLAYYQTLDVGLHSLRREQQLEVYDQCALYGDISPKTPIFREFENDWLRPNQLMDALGIGVELPEAPLPVAIHLYHATDKQPKFGDRGVALLRLLLPAFKAGVRSHIALAARRHDLVRMIDATGQGVSLFEHGRLVHESASLSRLLEREPEAVRVRLHLQTLARCAGVGIQVTKTATSHYRLVPSRMSSGSVARGECILVTVERLMPAALSDAELRDRFRLTPREIQVARLIAAGHRNQGIADELGMRPNTAWRHTERILAKLGVHNRSAVGPALRS